MAVTFPACRIRLAEPFEQLRDASDRMLAKTGARPKVFLANLGKLADFTARAMFAKNFFEAGGIEAAGNDGSPSDALVGGFQELRRQARLPVLVGRRSMPAKPRRPPTRCAAGARASLLAGRPGERETGLEAAGVETFISCRLRCLATLTRRACYPLGEKIKDA